MNKRILLSIAVFALILVPAAAYAASPWTAAPDYTSKVEQKLVFGLDNVFLGWTELFTQPCDSHKAGENYFVGIGKGLWNAIGQTAGGALHVLTFPVPIDVPLPENGTKLGMHSAK